MRRRDVHDVMATLTALVFDTAAIFGGFVLAIWIRFHTDLIPVTHGTPGGVHVLRLSLVATALFLITFRALGLYRGNIGRFEDKIPRIVRAIIWGFFVYISAEAVFRFEPRFSRPALAIAFFTITAFVLIERYVLYRIEWNLARHLEKVNRVLVLGTDHVAARLSEAFQCEPFLRSQVVGFLSTGPDKPHVDLPGDSVIGEVGDLADALRRSNANQVVLTDIGIGHEQMVDLIVTCEKQMVSFQLVPDLFRILTSGVDIQNIAGIPVMGIGKWPLDYMSKRILKRVVDVAGSLGGLVLSSPVIAVAAVLIKATSPGPVFYAQERCGENGKPFKIFKLRTMRANAEQGEQPGWTTPDDPRRTRVGGILRKLNIDELPQFWNVLKGDMSLVGPRPERPYFVARFKEDIERYMRRHVYKPGITGWAQVNGLRGDTSIEERIRLDLFYLENWSLALDFKILIKTLVSRHNAY